MWSVVIIIFLVSTGLFTILLSQPTNNYVLGASTWTQTSDRDFDNGTSENLTIVGSNGDAELQIDLSELKHWQEQFPGSAPTSRAYFGMATVDGDDKAVLWGGTWYLTDTWVYDYSTNKWIDKTPNPIPSSYPLTRYYPRLSSIYGDDKVVLFGGQYGSSYMDDTWEYDVSTDTWTEKAINTTKPTGRGNGGLAPIGGHDKMLLFGGYNWGVSGYYMNDTWVYDSSDGSWTDMTPVTPPSSYPSIRWAPNMVSIHGTDKVLMFGGLTTYSNYYSDTWIYDLSANSWTKKTPVSGSPTGRAQAGMATIYGDDKVVMFGGMTYSGGYKYYDDTWVFDLSDNTWTKVEPLNPNDKPAARGALGMAAISGTDKAVMFGGISGSTYNSDTWIYKHFLKTKNGTYVSAPHDTGSEAEYQTLSWYADTPEKTSVRLQLRSALDETKLANKPFVGPDGSSSSYYETSGVAIWSEHSGDRWIQYKAYLNIDIVTNSPALRDVTISYNCLPNTLVIGPTDGSMLTTNKPVFKWTFEDVDSDKQKGFEVIIDDDDEFGSIDFDSGEQNIAEEQWLFPVGTSYTEIPDGKWYWSVRTKDFDGTWTEYSTPREMWIDTHAPSSATKYPGNNGYYNSVTEITGIANDIDPGTGVASLEIAIKRLSDNNYWDGSAWVPLATWLLAAETHEWSYDASIVPWLSGVKYSVQSRAIDAAGNLEQSEIINVFTIDKQSPKSSILRPVDGVWLNNLGEITGSAMDFGGSGIGEMAVSIVCKKDFIGWDTGPKEGHYWDGNAWTNKIAWLDAVAGEQWSFNASGIPFTTGDHYTISSRAIDRTGNDEESTSAITFKYDSLPPSELGLSINSGAEFTGSNMVTLSIEAVDIGSGLAKMSFSSDGIVWSAWEPFNTTRNWELSMGDGIKTLYLRTQDKTGNKADAISDTIILDTTAPRDLVIEINDNEQYTNIRRLEASLMATDAGSGVAEMSYSYDSINWLPWEPFVQSKHIYLSSEASNGEKKIFYKVRDAVGNIAEPVYDNIILDTEPPYSLSITINEGNMETNSTRIKLELFAKDLISGIDKISFSLDGEKWSPWEEYSESKTYDLSSGDGVKTVFFKVKDKLGNVAEPASTTIMLNTTKTIQKGNTIETTNDIGLLMWLGIVIAVILVLIVLMVAMYILRSRKRRAASESVPGGTLTVRPGGIAAPVYSIGQVPSTLKNAQLPAGVAAAATSTGVRQVPLLAKSTQTAMPVQAQPGMPTVASPGYPTSTPTQVQNLPQLPPARIPSIQPTTPTPTVKPAISVQTSSSTTNTTISSPATAGAATATRQNAQSTVSGASATQAQAQSSGTRPPVSMEDLKSHPSSSTMVSSAQRPAPATTSQHSQNLQYQDKNPTSTASTQMGVTKTKPTQNISCPTPRAEATPKKCGPNTTPTSQDSVAPSPHRPGSGPVVHLPDSPTQPTPTTKSSSQGQTGK
jgi:hypothetical protein